jgi:hypothetical protein
MECTLFDGVVRLVYSFAFSDSNLANKYHYIDIYMLMASIVYSSLGVNLNAGKKPFCEISKNPFIMAAVSIMKRCQLYRGLKKMFFQKRPKNLAA